jgi:hypothetical protein
MEKCQRKIIRGAKKGKKGKTTRNGSKRDKGKRESTLKDFKAWSFENKVAPKNSPLGNQYQPFQRIILQIQRLKH